MKKFRFDLERVREWRGQQAQLEELKFERVNAERVAVEAEHRKIRASRDEAGRAILGQAAAKAQELAALDAYIRYTWSEEARLAKRLADCEKRVSEQRAAVMEAQRRLKLLERLRERRLAAWEAGLAREEEIQAGELFLARLGR
ncbi:MAG: hypothetical protein WD696_12295 [Bryobacteraceae bacterium]